MPQLRGTIVVHRPFLPSGLQLVVRRIAGPGFQELRTYLIVFLRVCLLAVLHGQ